VKQLRSRRSLEVTFSLDLNWLEATMQDVRVIHDDRNAAHRRTMALLGSGSIHFLSSDAYRRDWRGFQHAVYRDTLFGIVGYRSAA
jgi:hypothetical protein